MKTNKTADTQAAAPVPAAFQRIAEAIGSATTKHVAGNTILRRTDSGAIALRFYDTDVLTFHPDGRTEANSGGFRTATTKKRLNEWLPDGYQIGAVSGQWHWFRNGERVASFDDGDSVSPAGGIIARLPEVSTD